VASSDNALLPIADEWQRCRVGLHQQQSAKQNCHSGQGKRGVFDVRLLVVPFVLFRPARVARRLRKV